MEQQVTFCCLRATGNLKFKPAKADTTWFTPCPSSYLFIQTQPLLDGSLELCYGSSQLANLYQSKRVKEQEKEAKYSQAILEGCDPYMLN